jgi:hypothetical protein
MPSATVASAVLVLLTAGIVSVRLTRSARQEVRRRAGTVAAAAIVIVALLIWLGFSVGSDPPFQIEWEPSPIELMLLAAAPWVVVLVLLVLISRLALRWQWKSKASLRRPRTIRLDEQGLHNHDDVTSMLYRWPYFRCAWETENLLVLDDENGLRHILPKRAFVEVGEVEVARSLIGTHVADSKFSVTLGGFPVNRPAQAPVPAIPVMPAIPVDEAKQRGGGDGGGGL